MISFKNSEELISTLCSKIGYKIETRGHKWIKLRLNNKLLLLYESVEDYINIENSSERNKRFFGFINRPCNYSSRDWLWPNEDEDYSSVFLDEDNKILIFSKSCVAFFIG